MLKVYPVQERSKLKLYIYYVCPCSTWSTSSQTPDTSQAFNRFEAADIYVNSDIENKIHEHLGRKISTSSKVANAAQTKKQTNH